MDVFIVVLAAIVLVVLWTVASRGKNSALRSQSQNRYRFKRNSSYASSGDDNSSNWGWDNSSYDNSSSCDNSSSSHSSSYDNNSSCDNSSSSHSSSYDNSSSCDNSSNW